MNGEWRVGSEYEESNPLSFAPRPSPLAQYPSTFPCSKLCERADAGSYPFRHFVVSFIKTILT
jgi:hypothetical protein